MFVVCNLYFVFGKTATMAEFVTGVPHSHTSALLVESYNLRHLFNCKNVTKVREGVKKKRPFLVFFSSKGGGGVGEDVKNY